MSTLLDALKNKDKDSMDVEELVILAVSGRQVKGGFETWAIPIPDWLDESLKKVERTIVEKRRDYLEATLRTVKLERENLRTAEEKRTAKDAEIARLEKLFATPAGQ